MTVSSPLRPTSAPDVAVTKPLRIRRLPSPTPAPSVATTMTVARLAALTGTDRDRVIDLLRLVSLIVVIAGHSIMLTVAVSGGRVDLGNLLGDVPALQIATWLLQILPLFFFAGAAASTYGWRAAPDGRRSAGHWLFARAQRLLRPVFWYLIVVGVVMGILAAVGDSAVLDVVARLGVQLLWFLGAYLMILAVVPLMQRIDDASTLVAAVLGCYAVTAVMDLLRLTTGAQEWGYVNYVAVWTIPALLGVGYAKRLIRPFIALVVALGTLAMNVVLVTAGPYEVSLVTVAGQKFSNMTPPSLLLAGHAVVLCALAVASARALARIVARPRLWWWVALGNRGAMTLYLWHLPMLALIIAGGMALGFDRSPSAPGYGWTVAGETVLVLIVMIPVVGVLSRLENTPLRWWDGARAASTSPLRDAAVWTLLAAAGLAILMVARFGLIDDGLRWLAIGVFCVVAARLLTAPATASAGQGR
ncbi:acyltransferase [Gordonia sp. TBRC 11910]|uniref:Acyltransferase n=1 Tax=Gordonia asplenii TaxID=2725283 RepID=A0A848L2Y8_9ACTN|nr:acyltransferase [Gordonia asplenii]NMO04877.1 acyltransferase [Gordonia asplenii]